MVGGHRSVSAGHGLGEVQEVVGERQVCPSVGRRVAVAVMGERSREIRAAVFSRYACQQRAAVGVRVVVLWRRGAGAVALERQERSVAVVRDVSFGVCCRACLPGRSRKRHRVLRTQRRGRQQKDERKQQCSDRSEI